MTDELAALLERPGPGSHRTTIVIDGVPTDTLADLPPLRGKLLFVGLNPSPVSVEAGHYFQGRLGRAFWGRLMQAQILPADADIPTADDALVAAGHGLTDLQLDVRCHPGDDGRVTGLQLHERLGWHCRREKPAPVGQRNDVVSHPVKEQLGDPDLGNLGQ